VTNLILSRPERETNVAAAEDGLTAKCCAERPSFIGGNQLVIDNVEFDPRLHHAEMKCSDRNR
jgi:hypothetical protein